MGSAGTAGPVGHYASMRGYSMIELMVAITIFGIVARTAIPHFDARKMKINAAQQLVTANLRMARAKAITKSLHYRINFSTANQIQVQPMVQQVDGTWSVDTPNVQTVPLPSYTHFATGSQCVSPCTPIVGTNIEFNSRGIATNLAALAQVTLIDDFGVLKALQAWPSGQVNEL